MKVLDLFSGSQSLALLLRAKGFQVTTVDIVQYKDLPRITHHLDIFDFDERQYPPDHFDFLYIGLPCDTFSKASGGYHFKNNITPITLQAHTSILLIGRVYEILKYFNFPPFLLENPQGGLRNNFFFKNHCYFSKVLTYSTSLQMFGFPTQKKTDLFTNLDFPLFFPTSYRVNGRYAKKSLDNMTKRARSTYPMPFCEKIYEIILTSKLAKGKKKPPNGVDCL